MADPTQVDSASAVRQGSEQDRTLVIERVFKAPPEKVFNAWTNPEILVKWWGPDGMNSPPPQMDVREGGAWRTVMVSPKGDSHTVSGVYREVAPPHRLVMTWTWDQADGGRGHETMVELTFETAPEGTKLRLVQSVFENVEQRDSHRMGWESSFDCLDRVFG